MEAKVLYGIIGVAVLAVALALFSGQFKLSTVSGSCEDINLGTSCNVVADCINALPVGMPKDISSVGEMSCKDSVCHLSLNSCKDEIYGP